MIDSKSLDNSIGIAEKMASANITLDAVDGSALAHVIGSMDFIPNNPKDADEIRKVVWEKANNEEHDGTMNIIADNAARSVLGTHRFVTDVVNPHIRSVLGKINEEYADIKEEDGKLDIKVEIKSLPRAMDSANVEEAVGKIASMDLYSDSATPVDLGSYTDEEILDNIKFTKTDGYDDELESALRSEAESFDVIRAVLAGELTPSSRLTPAQLVAIVLLTQSLAHTDNIKEGIATSLNGYKARLNWISTFTARILQERYNDWRKIVKGRFLYVPGTENIKNCISVVSETFQQLDSKGVTIEHLIGNNLIGRKFGYVDFLENENAKNESMNAFETAKNDRIRNSHIRNRENLVKITLTAIKNNAIELSEDTEVLSRLNDDKASLINRATIACENIFTSDKYFDEGILDEVVAGLLCAIYYAHTDAMLYLNSIADFSKKYPDMNPIDLAKMARTNLLVNWVYRQIAVVTK